MGHARAVSLLVEPSEVAVVAVGVLHCSIRAGGWLLGDVLVKPSELAVADRVLVEPSEVVWLWSAYCVVPSELAGVTVRNWWSHLSWYGCGRGANLSRA